MPNRILSTVFRRLIGTAIGGIAANSRAEVLNAPRLVIPPPPIGKIDGGIWIPPVLCPLVSFRRAMSAGLRRDWRNSAFTAESLRAADNPSSHPGAHRRVIPRVVTD